LIPFLELAVQHIAAPDGRCFHLSLPSTEMAEASFGQSPQLNNVAAIFAYKAPRDPSATRSELAKIALAVLYFDHVASFIESRQHWARSHKSSGVG
jgi:hypothetical protein